MSLCTYQPSVRTWLSSPRVHLPYKSQLLDLGDTPLAILVLLLASMLLLLKAYWLSMVYSSYKWLLQEARLNMQRHSLRGATARLPAGGVTGTGASGGTDAVIYEFEMPPISDESSLGALGARTLPPVGPVMPPKYEDVLCKIPINANAPPPYILSQSQIPLQSTPPSSRPALAAATSGNCAGLTVATSTV